MGNSSQITQWSPLPTINAELVKELKKLGVKQISIARAIGVTPAAVSQYVKNKRGNAVKLDGQIKESVVPLARRIASNRIGDEDVFREIYRLALLARKLREADSFSPF
ncbi:MAG: hypothetical protein ABIF01_03265 [Candidatus Micrarchaeota archaeon]